MTNAYARLPNEIMGSPPVVAHDCLMHAMFVKGDERKQQEYCDAALNALPDAPCRFDVAGDRVLVTSIYASSMGSSLAPDRDRGVMQEVDIAFWSLVNCRWLADDKPDESFWLPSFLFVDTAYAMAAGREVFGYPKNLANIVRQAQQPRRADVDVDVLHFPQFGPEERPITETLVRISGPQTGDAPESNALAEIGALVIDTLGLAGLPDLGGEGLPLPGFGMPQVMLRQYRDATRAGTTALQEIIALTPQPSNVRRYGVLPNGLSVQVTPSASHDIAGTLGLSAENPVELGFWMEFDFTVGWGRKLA